MPVLRWARQSLPAIEHLTDYSATLVKRDRIDGNVSDYEYMSLKIRHKPFSVYVYFQGPAKVRGQEVIYVEGQNDGKMWAHRGPLMGTLSLWPDSPAAMKGRHHPLTDIGLVNLVRRLIEVGEQDANYGECEVQYFPGAKINGRSCTVIQVLTRRFVAISASTSPGFLSTTNSISPAL